MEISYKAGYFVKIEDGQMSISEDGRNWTPCDYPEDDFTKEWNIIWLEDEDVFEAINKKTGQVMITVDGKEWGS